MKISFPNEHKWLKLAVENPESLFGKKTRQKITSTLRKLPDTISHSIEPVSGAFFDWFVPFYETNINSKANPAVYDIRSKITEKAERGISSHALTLFENGQQLGATIFSIRDKKIGISYRSYSNTWHAAQLPANPSLYTEYVISKYAFECGKKYLGHGKDRNPYGLNSNIGLAAFKLSTGNQPKMRNEYETLTLETDELTTDCLFFLFPEGDAKEIKRALLVTTRENEEKYAQVTKYPELVSVEVIYRS